MSENEKKSKKKNIAWQKLLPELQKELDRKGLDAFQEISPELSSPDSERVQALRQTLSRKIHQEIERNVTLMKSKPQKVFEKCKQISLALEKLPFRLAARSQSLEQSGKPWRHDGGTVKFKLNLPHQQLEIFSLEEGEFICSFPVQPSGEVIIDDLEPGIYLLHLKGRKIVDLDALDR